MTQTGTLPGTLPATETLPPPPAGPNGGATPAAFGAVLPAAIQGPSHEQAKLNELHDLALQIKAQDSIVEERKNDLKSERGKREQLVQKHLQLSLETTLPLRAEAAREPTMFDGPPPWSEKLTGQQFAAVKVLINQVRRENRGEPLRMMRLGDEVRLFLRIKDKPAEQVWAFGKTGEQGDVSALPWSAKQLSKAEAIYSWEERPARELPEQCVAVSEEIMRLAEAALGRQPDTDNEETPNGLLGTFEFEGVQYAPTEDSHHDVPGSQLCLPVLSPKEFKSIGATIPADAGRNGPLFGIRKRDPDNGSKPFHFGPLYQGIYLVAPDVLEAYRANKTEDQAGKEVGPPVGSSGVSIDGLTHLIAREVGLTFDELNDADCSTLLQGTKGKAAPKIPIVQLGVNIHAVVSQKPGEGGVTEFTLLPLFPRDEFAAAPQRTAAEAMESGPDSGNRLAGVAVAVAREEYCIGTDEGMQIVEATPPEKPKRGNRKAK
jgi:hypothetical protein